MAKKEKVKKESRGPALAAFVDSSFKIYLKHGKKEYDATVLSSGVIRYNDKDYDSASSAAKKIVGVAVNGWRAWSFNKDGVRVALDTLRGSKSPLKAAPEKPKKERKAKSAKPNGSAPKPKAPRKPRVRKPLRGAAAPVQAEATA